MNPNLQILPYKRTSQPTVVGPDLFYPRLLHFALALRPCCLTFIHFTQLEPTLFESFTTAQLVNMRATSVVALVAALAPAALAGPYFTAPVAGTVCEAGKPCVITWQDDGKAPDLPTFGDCSVGVFAGSSQQQSLIQNLAVTNAQTAQTVQFVPDPAAGEDSTAYFIKMVSINTADPAMPQYKATAYSAMFTLKGMTGKFNETVQAQIAGTAASSGAAGSAAPATSTVVSTSTAAKAASTPTTGSSSTNGTSNNATNSNGAGSITVAGMGLFGATVLAALAAVL
ncbi:unnamed protein product [Rhizoctonia solani]|uniref:Yeast cell wall synthesis Kre9/Knh1-like N-terminal domain-containing protein n=1 Tax=Rhizoctonia solani TaxID=456999 RepID=A0A8H2XQA8_9AGAM|nr:unnamed protein product [Rhizoctonia solani]